MVWIVYLPRSTILDDKKENFVSLISHICIVESKLSIDLSSNEIFKREKCKIHNNEI